MRAACRSLSMQEDRPGGAVTHTTVLLAQPRPNKAEGWGAGARFAEGTKAQGEL